MLAHHVKCWTRAHQIYSAGDALQEVRSLHAAGLLKFAVLGGGYQRRLSAPKWLACRPRPGSAAKERAKHRCRVRHQNVRRGRPRQGAVAWAPTILCVFTWVPQGNSCSTLLGGLVRIRLQLVSRRANYAGVTINRAKFRAFIDSFAEWQYHHGVCWCK